MGIHINGDHNIVGDNNTVVHGDVIYGDSYDGPSSGPPVGFFGIAFFVIILIGLIIKFWWIALILASLGALAYGTHLEREEKRRVEVEARRREEALAARAEGQNSAYLRGESWGTYGIHPPGKEVNW